MSFLGTSTSCPTDSFVLNMFFLKILFIFRETGKEGEREGKRHQCVRDTLTGCLSHTPNWGPYPQPSHVLWLGNELATVRFTGWRSIHWATPARAVFYWFLKLHTKFIVFAVKLVSPPNFPNSPKGIIISHYHISTSNSSLMPYISNPMYPTSHYILFSFPLKRFSLLLLPHSCLPNRALV